MNKLDELVEIKDESDWNLSSMWWNQIVEINSYESIRGHVMPYMGSLNRMNEYNVVEIVEQELKKIKLMT